MRSTLIPLVLVMASCASDELAGRVPDLTEVADALETEADDADALAALLDQPTVPADPVAHDEIWRFYAQRGHRPAFTSRRGASSAGEQLLALLEDAAADGLDPAAYGTGRLRSRLGFDTPTERVSVEYAFAAAALRYARHLAYGRTEPIGRWHPRRQELDLAAALATAVDEDLALLRQVAPTHPQYQRLRESLARYRALSTADWPDLPTDAVLAPGDASDHGVIVPLARRLAAEGWLQQAPGDTPPGWAGPQTYGEDLAQAVRRFQEAHGLQPDGVLGPSTWAALAAPLTERIAQLERNLERWRWAPDDLGATHIRVNIPSFALEMVRDGERVARMPVVVGRPHTATPVFSDAMERIVFNPYWNVPVSIATDEILPKAQRNPGWLAANGYEVVDARGRRVSARAVDWSRSSRSYRVRQRPGRGNALGRIKFLFPNDHAVYLHDTPSRHLFARPARAFSHGCVRVGEPLVLADHVLDDWTLEEVEQAVRRGRHRVVELPETIPVHLLYFTAEVADDGTVRFFEDVYGLDRDHADAIEAREAEGAEGAA